MSTLSVELNGDAVHSIRAPDRFEATGPFAVALENEGRSTHVHLHFDDDLDRVASVAETNHFVDDESTRHVHVAVDDVTEPVRGKLKIVTGYGSNTRYVNVRIDPPEETVPEEVAVDEAFTKPPERPPEVSPSQRAANAVDRLIERGGVPAAIAAFLALAAGVAIALALDSAVVSVVVAVVLVVSLGAALLAAW
ncbi:DUF7524 family protein [Halorubrum lipolyticum]|uniref:Uncharacterized protein n=1 Tax=Halorubrum lipolyticum DSM 21995 TaxID=1227482 RepID=M0P2U1_9EURY|nr:hypothetical protein [Halorubrum lipolyticum]EMA63110.1 hypothetical protein C469_03780 [Halorubrum lipolyticum DSM 21995]